MKKLYLFILLLVFSKVIQAQEQAWVYFTDKENVAAAIANPITILSQEAIDRKNLHNTPIDARDVPVNENYIATIKNQQGISVMAKSKWFNCVHVIGSISAINALENLNFVDHIDFADKSLNSRPVTADQISEEKENLEMLEDFNYGISGIQVEMIRVDYLHENDFTGDGMVVAVMDSGFPGVNSLGAFNRLVTNNGLLGGYDFVNRTEDYDAFTANDHGTKVLSTMAGFVDNELVGTAPDANYYLFRTEDVASETPVEESYWVEAAERADSLGVDVINTSLGYQDYDNPNYSYTPADMDGNTAFITRGANIAVEKGILVVVSAGNSGNNESFPIIGAPADGDAFTVGAVNGEEEYVSFSSIGPNANGTIKPDVMAMGYFSTVINTENEVSFANGTSFSSPIMAGAVTSFWQIDPSKTNLEIMQLVRESASLYNNPTNEMGYGIPNFQLAFNSLDSTENNFLQLKIYPNPVQNKFFFANRGTEKIQLELYNLLGQLIFKRENISSEVDISHLSSGIYIAKLQSNQQEKTIKIIKQ